MKIMITGARGMLGRTLAKYLERHDLFPVDIDDFDLTDAGAVRNAVQSFLPDVVLHAAAMTAVDRCEIEPDAAFAANAVGSANIAAACRRHSARLIAYSTDYVFSGRLDRPYHEWDETGPQNIYGQSKLAGELSIAKHCPNHLICRLAWLYGKDGPSFLHTMLKLGMQNDRPLKVVDDQIGNPTSADAVAEHTALLLEKPVVGIMHLTCEGEISWHGFATEVFRLWGIPGEITPCASAEFPRPAKRPNNSRLEKRALRLNALPPMPDWKTALSGFHSLYPNG